MNYRLFILNSMLNIITVKDTKYIVLYHKFCFFIYFLKMDTTIGLTNFDILSLVPKLKIINFRGVFARDNLPKKPLKNESGVINLNRKDQRGSHWLSYYKRGDERIVFDSFGCVIPLELQKYLKTKTEYEKNIKCIWRCTQRNQDFNSSICGHLSLFVLYLLQRMKPKSFDKVIETIQNYGSVCRFLHKIEKLKKT